MKTPSESSVPPAREGGDFFAGSHEHLLAELERIDLMIRLQVTRARQLYEADPEFRGLYVAEDEVDGLLAAPAGLPRWAAAEDGWPPDLRDELARLGAGIEARAKESVRRGVDLRFGDLSWRFGLSAFETDALLIALAPEVDLRYERLFSYLQDDVTKKRPSVDLVLNLLCSTLEEKLAARACFSDGAPLMRHRLLERHEDPSRPQPPLLATYLKVDPRIASFLFEDNRLDPRLAPYGDCRAPSARFEDLVQPAAFQERLRALAEGEGAWWILYFQGSDGVGKETTAEALCRSLGLSLYLLDLERLLTADDELFLRVLDLAGREAVLLGAALYWHRFDLLLADDQRVRRSRFLRHIEEYGGPVFLAGEATWEPTDALHGRSFLRFEFPRPTYGERLELWSRNMDGILDGTAVDLAALATKFHFTPGQIRDAAATAASIAHRRSADDVHVGSEDLYAACRLQSNRKLSELALKIVPRYSWEDIVLPADRLEQLREIANCVKQRSRVYEEWGFGEKLSLGKGLAVLFSGPSGTGKTMAAEVLAAELGLDLYKIDLSSVVSKYIGETEKNLSKIFQEAETSNAILFFDEADALFGKRSEVRDSHDRYANLEISYLLQRMEEYEGVAILATNLKKNMDEAFVRRMHFAVEFPFPDTRSRQRIWTGIWPREVPRHAEVDLGFLAGRFEIAGGNIKNIAVAASFLAAGDGGRVEMPHLLRATRREYQKMGKVVAEEEFWKAGREHRREGLKRRGDVKPQS